MHNTNIKGVFKNSVQLFPDHFFPPPFHPSGLHNDHVTQVAWMLFRKVKHCKGHSEEKNLQLRPPSLTDSLKQSIKIIQKETAVSISREVNKFFNHVDQR